MEALGTKKSKPERGERDETNRSMSCVGYAVARSLIASHPAAAQVLGFGIDAGYPTYPAYYSRVYGYPYGYASYPYYYMAATKNTIKIC
jgi:hypothetical protein